MKKINNDFSHIKELITEIEDLINPITGEDMDIPVMHSEFAWLMHKDNNIRFSEEHPKCVFPVNIGRTVIFLPACNRAGVQDKNIVQLALTFVRKLTGQSDIDVPRGELKIMQAKLEDLLLPKASGGPEDEAKRIALDKMREYDAAVKAPPASEL